MESNSDSAAARSDLFDKLPTAALQRISSHLRFNPPIPPTEFSLEKKDLQTLPAPRQEQWLNVHRGEIWTKFVQAAVPLLEVFKEEQWTYEKILTLVLTNLGSAAKPVAAPELELLIVEKIWEQLPKRLPNSILTAAILNIGEMCAIVADKPHIEAYVIQRLACRNRELIVHICTAILKFASKKQLEFGELFLPEPIKNGGIKGWISNIWDEATQTFGEPSYGRVVPVVIEILKERLSESSLDQPTTDIATTRTKPNTPVSEESKQSRLVEVSAMPARPSRAEIEKDFIRAIKILEHYLKDIFPPNNPYGEDKRTLGQMVEAVEYLRFGQRELNELRNINRTRKLHIHGKGEVSDLELIQATRIAREWLKRR